MSKRLLAIIISAIIILLAMVVVYSHYFPATQPSTDTNIPVTYATVTENELVILHLNAKVDASKVEVKLELTSHTKTDDGIDTAITVRDLAGTELGQIRFSQVDETQTIGSYRFRLVNATQSAVQVLALATAAE